MARLKAAAEKSIFHTGSKWSYLRTAPGKRMGPWSYCVLALAVIAIVAFSGTPSCLANGPAPEGSIAILETEISFDGVDDFFDEGMKTAAMFAHPFTLTFDITSLGDPGEVGHFETVLDSGEFVVRLDVGPNATLIRIESFAQAFAQAEIETGTAYAVTMTADEIAGDVVFDIYLDGSFAATGSDPGDLLLATQNLIVGTNHAEPPPPAPPILPFGRHWFKGLLGPIVVEAGVTPP